MCAHVASSLLSHCNLGADAPTEAVPFRTGTLFVGIVESSFSWTARTKPNALNLMATKPQPKLAAVRDRDGAPEHLSEASPEGRGPGGTGPHGALGMVSDAFNDGCRNFARRRSVRGRRACAHLWQLPRTRPRGHAGIT
jgi:hypothetical protein